MRLLEFIQSKLPCGGIYPKDPNNQNYDYRVVSKDQLLQYIVPLFKLYPMHTIKHRRFELFLEALSLNDPYDPRFTVLKDLMANIPLDYKSPFLHIQPSKSWLVGFIEAEDSFHIIERRSRGTLEHGFNVVQKRDVPILEHIRTMLNISANTHEGRIKSIIATRRFDNLMYISKYLDNTMVGVKHDEFILWRDSLYQDRGMYNKLRAVRQIMRDMRNRHKRMFDPDIDIV